MFSDWNHMDFKQDLEVNKDFVLVNQLVWSKLVHTFGGTPEITFFIVDKSGGQGHSKEETDFNPIKV